MTCDCMDSADKGYCSLNGVIHLILEKQINNQRTSQDNSVSVQIEENHSLLGESMSIVVSTKGNEAKVNEHTSQPPSGELSSQAKVNEHTSQPPSGELSSQAKVNEHTSQPPSGELSSQAKVNEHISQPCAPSDELLSEETSGVPNQRKSVKLTSPPDYLNPSSGRDEVDGSGRDEVDALGISSYVDVPALMVDFSSGPKMRLLPLENILLDRMELRSLSKGFLQVIRKTKEDPEATLLGKKDGHHWEISSGEDCSFYMSCGKCNKGCFLVEMSDGEKHYKKESVD